MKPIILGISGASGAIYGIRLLEEMKKQEIETHVVISKWGSYTIKAETDYCIEDVIGLASFYYEDDDLAARISSGSFKASGMIIAPCSMKTLSGIANGYSEDLIVRAADVCLKEQRKLVLLTRETPLSQIHLQNMLTVSRAGGVIAPPMPSFYTRPTSLEDMIDQTVGRILDQFDIPFAGLRRWEG